MILPSRALAREENFRMQNLTFKAQIENRRPMEVSLRSKPEDP
jgi:hypothetical protein